MNPTTNQYWHCVIGPFSKKLMDETYPYVTEGPPRRAAIDAISEMLNTADFTCSSGFFSSDSSARSIFYATVDDDTKVQLIDSYYLEGKPIPRELKAWELLFAYEKLQTKPKRSSKRKAS